MSTSRLSADGRVRTLDGLRALAIGLVVGFHAAVPGFSGGWVGVTVFFVLSGFLITGVLLKPSALTWPGLRRFFARRALRLFPAVFALVGASLVLALFLSGHDRHYLLIQCLATVTYTMDFFLGRGAVERAPGYLGQTWSLAAEEQFYLVWPILLIAITRVRKSRLGQAALTLAIALAFTLWRAHLGAQGLNQHIGENIDGQADGLLIGCALALALPDLRQRLARRQSLLTLSALTGFAAILAISTGVAPAIPFQLNRFVIAVASAAVIVRFVIPASDELGRRLERLFSLRFVVWIGLISYSIYLWHRFVIEVLKHVFTIQTLRQRIEFAPLMLGITLAVSAGSYYWIEQRFLRLKDRYEEQGQNQSGVPSDRPYGAAITDPVSEA